MNYFPNRNPAKKKKKPIPKMTGVLAHRGVFFWCPCPQGHDTDSD